MMQIYQRTRKMREKFVDTLARLYEYSTTVFSREPFTQWYDSAEGGYTYGNFKLECDRLSKLLTQYGVGESDKVAIFSQSMPNWSVAFFSAVAFGRIAIPILPDSSENEVNNIFNHSESDVLFVSQRLYPKISDMVKGKMKLIVDMDTLEVIKSDDSRHVVSYVLRGKSVLSPETSGSGSPAESHEDGQADHYSLGSAHH